VERTRHASGVWGVVNVHQSLKITEVASRGPLCVLLKSERECCLLVFNSVTSTPQWIRQPEAAWLCAWCLCVWCLCVSMCSDILGSEPPVVPPPAPWSKYPIFTNTGNNRASTERCRERGSENANRAKQSIGGVVPLQPACPRRGDTSLDVHNS
jgi:hypothetical protein